MTSKDTQIILSDEKQFIFHDAYNRGFTQVPKMVIACRGLSIQAKGVYNYISNYVYEHGKSAFPSVHRIAAGCELTAKSVVKHISELVNKGLLKKVRRGRGRTNDYYLKDVHEVKTLHVSEMLWWAMDGALKRNKGKGWEEINKAVEAISTGLKKAGGSLANVDCTEEVRGQLEDDIFSILEGGEPELAYNIPTRPKTVTKTAGELGGATDSSGKSYKDRHESEWRTDDFRDHFYEVFKKLSGLSHIESVAIHRTILARALKNLDKDKTQLKKYIDAFFEIGYENKTLEWFGTSGRLAEIDLYLKEGKKPFYLETKAAKKKEEVANAVQENMGLSEEEALKRLRGGRR